MAEELVRSGLYFDDFYSLRVLDPEISSQTVELKDECENFDESKITKILF